MNSEKWLHAAVLSWGKTDVRGASQAVGGPAWNSLLAHLLDTAATTGALWDRYLPPSVTSRLADAFGNGQHHHGRRMVMFLAALHDMGKASDCFQRQFGTGRPASPRTRTEREKWEKTARARGLPLADDLDAAPWARHEHITAAHLPRLLGCTCQECGGQANPHQGLHTVANLLGGHHGNIPQKDTVDRAAGAAPLDKWEPVYRALVEETARLIDVNLEDAPGLVTPQRPSAMTLFAGLVVLADWIASDEGQFPYRKLTETTDQWWAHSRRDADAALTRLKLDRWQPTNATWTQLWPGTQPRDFQAAATRILPQQGPALVIIESDTGSGKTCLALWCAHHFARTCGSHGLYMAMPTRAATNQIAEELHTFLQHASMEQTILAVVHGTAPATDIVHRLLDATDTTSRDLDDLAPYFPHDPTCSNLTDDQPPRAVLDPWYLRRCLGLVASFGIGTIDQLVLAAQKSRHWYLRLLGLATKTVIIDEAHAYELYQQDLFNTTISWLADAGASVVVLSATLPANARHALSNAWCHGHGTPLHDSPTDGPITVIDQHGHTRRTGPTTPPTPLHTHIDLHPDTGPTDLAQQLLHEGRHGGCIGVVRTRVASATQLYAEAIAHAPDAGWDPTDIVLLHGRLMPRHRLPLENTLTALLGTGPDRNRPNPRRPHRLLVIATQVIEQSLDLDFDRLYSDLAPIDLLIQRRGRLHRHTLNNPGRPQPFTAPHLTVWWKPDRDGLPRVEPPDHHNGRHTGNPDGYVYAPYTLAATWHTLTNRTDTDGTIHTTTPKDSTPLIEAVYGTPTTTHGPIAELLNRTHTTWQKSLTEERRQAQERCIPPYSERRRTPVTIHELAAGQAHGDGDDKGTQGIAALSRLGDPSINAIALYQQPDGTLTYDSDAHHPADLTHTDQTTPQRTAQHRAQQRNMLLNTLTLPHSWFTGRNPLPPTETWPALPHPPLRHHPVLLLTPDGTCVSGPQGHIAYHPVTGLTRL